MDTKELLHKKVSYQTTAMSPLSKDMTIGEVLNEIKSDKYLKQVRNLRALILNGQIEEYNIQKKNLPAVTFCGIFEGKRRKEFLKDYNKIVVLDIDKLDEVEIERIRTILYKDEFVFAFWDSPSKKGIKGLVSLSYKINIEYSNIDTLHKIAFKKLQNYFHEAYNIELDESGSDTPRLCFMSHDINLVCKKDCNFFEIAEIEIAKTDINRSPTKVNRIKSVNKKDLLFNPHNKNNPFNRKAIQAIIKYLTKHNLSITYTYDEWYRVAIAISNSFTYEIGEKYFLNLCRIDKDKFNEIDCKNLLIYSYENSNNEISFKTIEFLATNKGYKIKNQRVEVPKMANEWES